MKEKLKLNKQVITNLHDEEMNQIKGGATLSLWSCAQTTKPKSCCQTGCEATCPEWSDCDVSCDLDCIR